MKACIYCKSPSLTISIDKDNSIQYKGDQISVNLTYSFCNNCEREFITPEQVSLNDLEIKKSKRLYDGLLTAEQIKDARKKLGLTQETASLVFGGGKNAFSKYERSEIVQSVSMDNLIRASLNSRKTFYFLIKKANIELDSNDVEIENSSLLYQKKPAANEHRFRSVKVIPFKEVRHG